MHCILVGNYGVNNLGDEALRDYFVGAFPSFEWTVVSAHPANSQEIPRIPGGIRSFVSTPWYKTIRAFWRCDAVVFGGGSLFTDVESPYACFLWFLHALCARMFRKPVFLAFQGMGPYKTTLGEWLARWTARHAAFISVRDEASYLRLENWNLNKKVIQTFDPVLSLMVEKKTTTNTKNVFTIIPRHNSENSFVQEAQKILSTHQSLAVVNILLMQPDDPLEQAMAESLQNAITRPSTIFPVRTLSDLMKHVCDSSFILTQRFHGALAALAAGIPQTILSQGAGDKLSSVQRLLDDPDHSVKLKAAIQKGEESLQNALAAA